MIGDLAVLGSSPGRGRRGGGGLVIGRMIAGRIDRWQERAS